MIDMYINIPLCKDELEYRNKELYVNGDLVNKTETGNDITFEYTCRWMKNCTLSFLLVLHYCKVSLPFLENCKIISRFNDDDIHNLDAGNISYIHADGPVKWVKDPRYAYIPGYEKYVIDRDGNVLSLYTKKHKSWYIAKGGAKNGKGGYLTTRLVRNDMGSSIMQRHRLLCLTYKPNPDHPNLTVNHLNGKPGSDDLDNLEWATRAENNAHALETGLKNLKPVIAINTITNTSWRYPSARHAEIELGLGTDGKFIRQRIAQKVGVKEDGYVFIYDDGSPWPTIDGGINYTGRPTGIKVLNIFTNKETSFVSAERAAEYIGISGNSVMAYCKEESFVPRNGHLVKFEKSLTGWPILDQDTTMIAKAGCYRGVGYIVNDEIAYNSIQSLSTTLSVGRDTLGPLTKGVNKMVIGDYHIRKIVPYWLKQSLPKE